MSLTPRVGAAIGFVLLPLGIWMLMKYREASTAEVVSTVRPQAVAAEHQRSRARVFHETLDVRAGGTLIVDVADADVQIRTANRSRVEVEAFVEARDAAWGREFFEAMGFEAILRGSEVTVHAEDVRMDSHDRQSGGVAVTAVITIPTEFDVRVVTSDGDVSLEALRGNVDIQSSDGDVSVDEIVGGVVSLASSDGDITLGSVRAERASVRTSDGDITIRTVGGALEARTSDGDIRVSLDEAHELNFTTQDGDITIVAPPTLRASVTLEAADLVVASAFGLRGLVSGRSISGDLNGGGPRVSARSGDGEITMRVR